MTITIDGKTMTVERAVDIAEAEIFEHAYGAAVTYSRALFTLLLSLAKKHEEIKGYLNAL
jgi:hypothetical protein